MNVQRMALLAALMLVYSCAATPPKPQKQTVPTGSWLQSPRVRLVALTMLEPDTAGTRDAAVRWKQLDDEFRPLGLRIVALTQPAGGVCPGEAPFAVDRLVCDAGAEIATTLHMTGPGQCQLWDYRGRRLVSGGDVKVIETAVRAFYDDLPRLAVHDPVIRALPEHASGFSRNRVYGLLVERLGAGIKAVLTETDPARRNDILRDADPAAPVAPPACSGATLPAKGVVYSTVANYGGALRLDVTWVDAAAGCLVAKGSGLIGNGPDALETAVDEAVFPLKEAVKKQQAAVYVSSQGGGAMSALHAAKDMDFGVLNTGKNRDKLYPMSITGIQGAPEVKPKDTPATQRYQARCDDGAADDCVDLGWMLRTGEGVQVDFDRARRVLVKACGLGSALGCNDLGLMMELGEGQAADDKKAVYYYQLSCTMGNGHGCRNWGLMIENGKGVSAPDMQRAMELFRKSCDMENGLACNDVGHLLQHGKGPVAVDTPQAMTFYKRSCEYGSGHGCTNLGFMYEKGIAGTTDNEMAAQYYRYGCDYGNGTGCRNLGLLMMKGSGIPGDIVQANSLFSMACDLKDATGCRSLGTSYEQGRGVTPDLQRALALYRAACDAGNSDACVDAGYFYEKGMGTVRNYRQAFELYRRACDQNNRVACGNTGIMYDNGRGTVKNLAVAITLYKRACDMGNGGSCRNLGLKYEKGSGVAASVDTALELYRKGCDLGDSAACNDMGYLHEYGPGGMMKNPPLACTYYRKACDMGSPEGCTNFSRLCGGKK